MQAGGVTTADVYAVSGRVLVDGTDIGASVETISFSRDLPSGLPGDSGFTSATGRVTATWGDDVSDRVDHPWSPNPVWPPKPNSQVEVVLADGTGEWTQFKGVIVDPSGSTSTRTIRFGVRDNYRSLDRLVTIPALSRAMPALTDANHLRYVSLFSSWLTDYILRQCGRYATPPHNAQSVVSATLQGSTWPERGTVTASQKQVPDDASVAYPNFVRTGYGRAVQNVDALYSPNIWSGTLGGGRITAHPVELTQEVVPMDSGSTFLRARFPGGGQVSLAHNASTVFARYYRPNGSTIDLASLPRSSVIRVTARYSWSNGTLTGELRGQDTHGNIVSGGSGSVSATELSGVIDQVSANGTGSQGAFQVAFPSSAWSKLDFVPNAVIHVGSGGTNHLQGFPTQVNVNALDLINDQADAEFAQWWIDEHDVLQWWDRGMLAQQPIVGTLTGADHVQELSWSHDHDSARYQVHVQYKQAVTTTRWRTNLTLWQAGSTTLEQGDEDETFVNTPNDEIWFGVDLAPIRYSADTPNYWAINRGIKSVYGGIAVSDSGNERLTNSIIPTLRRITDETYVFETTVSALQSGENAALELPSEYDTDTALWARHRGEKLPILRGKKKITRIDETATSSITGPTSAPDYTHDGGDWIDTATYAGVTADYAAASLTQPRPRISGLDIMPVFALQAGDHIRVSLPHVAELEITGIVTSISISADLDTGQARQSISIMPTNVASLARRWADFGEAFGDESWQSWADATTNHAWADFGSAPLE